MRNSLRKIVPRKSGLILNAPKEKLTSNHKFSNLPKAKSKKRVAAGRVGAGAEKRRVAANLNIAPKKPKIQKVRLLKSY